ncbi:craniofacial development protein 2-like [Diabrotica virgifera virgifera]|uniref:Endonuclease/exonuclease/phosphatase domain-containing protein n=1 Tax=Diabrotica virgifera virgifera TaxID=50390 RepID=A0ABM5JHN6_DIAVI|nr:craniofacial development protein 2-like [Diabrotica virgifera virgifera]
MKRPSPNEIKTYTEMMASPEVKCSGSKMSLHSDLRVRTISGGTPLQVRKIRIGSWNLGSLTGKSLELVDALKRRRVQIACIQETRWKGQRAKELGDGYKLWYVGSSNTRNGVGIIADSEMKDNVVEVVRTSDRMMSVKFVIDKEVLNVVCVYAPQTGLGENERRAFYDQLGDILSDIPAEEKVIIGGDFNAHVGQAKTGYETIHGGLGFGTRNEAGDDMLELATALDMAIVNTFFKKRETQLITYKSGQHQPK